MFGWKKTDDPGRRRNVIALWRKDRQQWTRLTEEWIGPKGRKEHYWQLNGWTFKTGQIKPCIFKRLSDAKKYADSLWEEN